LSVYEKDTLMQNAESRLLGMSGVDAIYTRTTGNPGGDAAEDQIGTLQLEFQDWEIRPPAADLIQEVRERLADLPGAKVQIMEEESGLGGGKPIQIELSSVSFELLPAAVQQVIDQMNNIDGFIDIEDSRPLTGIEWQMNVNREEAARYGADIASLGSAVQMLTTGLMLAEYQPDDADEELDIRLRFNADARNMEQLSQLHIPTIDGQIPVSNFLQVETAQKVGNISRIDGNRTLSIAANVEDDYLADDLVTQLGEALPGAGLDPRVLVVFKGEQADQQEAATFLVTAFALSIFLMLAILLFQFNSFYQAMLILTAIIFSTAGVLLGLLITGNPFGIVMGGIGVIALAGIVVNNNIVLIDTFNEFRQIPGISIREAILETCAQRLRPVMLTSVTTILGLLPMVFGLSIDLIGRHVSIGAPSTQMWVQLSSAIAGGLFFATLLTLVMTPCMLMLGSRLYKTAS
jgi:multidrug efflux pump